MPAYNAEAYIAQSVESVIRQTFKNWELLVVNDGSTDSTPSIVKKFADADDRIILINQQNKRLVGARNTGIIHAKGNWIAFLDADDLWDAAKLEKQLLLAKAKPEVDVIFTSGYIFKNEDLDNLTHYKIISGKIASDQMYRYEYANNYIPVLSVLVKKNMVATVGLQEEDPNNHVCEDWDYWIRMAMAGATFYGMEDKLFYYRRHGSNMSDNKIKMLSAQIALLSKNYRPAIFTKAETRQIFIPTMNVLVIDLIKLKRKVDAKLLLYHIKDILPGTTTLYRILIALCNGKSIVVFEQANRVYRKIRRSLKIGWNT
jgi:teichuronic acid biosynthesis glycosyltransferase TuaG